MGWMELSNQWQAIPSLSIMLDSFQAKPSQANNVIITKTERDMQDENGVGHTMLRYSNLLLPWIGKSNPNHCRSGGNQ
jgi:hypothetical protein